MVNEETILLVEDELLLRDLYVLMLQKAGFTVITADDGEKGLHIGLENPTARVMLLDVMLPKMDGLAVLRTMKSDPKTQQLPIIMLSNLTDEGIIKEALETGAEAYLVKASFTPQELIDKVKEIILASEAKSK